MSFFDDPKNVEQYIDMSQGYDGARLVNALAAKLEAGATVLELGMGEGKDVALLSQHFQVTGSDASPVFVQRYLQRHPNADVLALDAVSIDTERQFHALYSNKVLHQLSPEQLTASFQQQHTRLLGNGLILHSFWLGTGSEEFAGDRTYYYQPAAITELMAPLFKVLSIETYTETDTEDSFFVLGQAIKN